MNNESFHRHIIMSSESKTKTNRLLPEVQRKGKFNFYLFVVMLFVFAIMFAVWFHGLVFELMRKLLNTEDKRHTFLKNLILITKYTNLSTTLLSTVWWVYEKQLQKFCSHAWVEDNKKKGPKIIIKLPSQFESFSTSSFWEIFHGNIFHMRLLKWMRSET